MVRANLISELTWKKHASWSQQNTVVFVSYKGWMGWTSHSWRPSGKPLASCTTMPEHRRSRRKGCEALLGLWVMLLTCHHSVWEDKHHTFNSPWQQQCWDHRSTAYELTERKHQTGHFAHWAQLHNEAYFSSKYKISVNNTVFFFLF